MPIVIIEKHGNSFINKETLKCPECSSSECDMDIIGREKKAKCFCDSCQCQFIYNTTIDPPNCIIITHGWYWIIERNLLLTYCPECGHIKTLINVCRADEKQLLTAYIECPICNCEFTISKSLMPQAGAPI